MEGLLQPRIPINDVEIVHRLPMIESKLSVNCSHPKSKTGYCVSQQILCTNFFNMSFDYNSEVESLLQFTSSCIATSREIGGSRRRKKNRGVVREILGVMKMD